MNVKNTPENRGVSSNDQVDITSKLNNSAAEKQANTQDSTAINIVAEQASVNKIIDKPAVEAKEKQQATLQREQLENMAQKLQEFVGSLNKGLEFSVDKDSGRDVIKVIDRDSQEVIRQYPSEEVLDLIANLSDAAGNFVNSKA
ncbi:MAG: flagellar protein FlaG [Gammaproteobacteria bacterium]|nr:flagellar protein FlaG [Gammaproteobacteria bacterium]